MREGKVKYVVLAGATIGAAVFLMVNAPVARGSIFAGPFDTIYADSFVAPAANVNSALTDPNSIVGNAPATSTGLDGGSASAVYIGIAQPQPGTGNPDAVWDYSGSNSAKITSPPANVLATGNIGEDSHTIDNLTLPVTPVLGFAYDLALTMQLPAVTGLGAHGLEMAFLFNNGNGHNTAVQAISNNNPVGLILDRDAASGGGYFDIFEGINTVGDTHFSPTSSALTGGNPGTTITVDSIFTPTGATTGTMSWYLNGVLANPTPVAMTGLSNGVSFIQFGDNQTTGGTFTNFSLTAQAVPEPTSMIGLMTAAGFMLLGRKRSQAL